MGQTCCVRRVLGMCSQADEGCDPSSCCGYRRSPGARAVGVGGGKHTLDREVVQGVKSVNIGEGKEFFGLHVG